MKNFATLIGLTLVLSLILTACGGGGGGNSGTSNPANPTLTSINVTGASSSVTAGSTLQLTAKGTYSDNSTSTLSSVIWTSSDPTVSTVNGTGLVTGMKAGNATITAKVGTVTGTMNVTVTSTTTNLTSITVTAPTTSMAAGATLQLTAQGAYSDGTTQLITSQVSWQTSDPTVATVSSSGVVTSLKAGPLTITASQSSVSGQIGITVTQATLASISVVPSTFSVASGQTKQLSVQGFYTDGTSQDVTAQITNWGSGATGVATVSSSGLVTGVGVGSATITATLGSLNASASANVTAAVLSSIVVKPTTPSVPVGQIQAFTANGVLSDGSSTDMTNSVVWSSSATNVATIDQTGTAKGVATGNTTIQATAGSVSGSTTLTVTSAVLQSIDITPDDQSIPVGGQLQLYVTGTYSDNTTQNLSNASWSSSNSTLASVDPSTGVVTGVANSNGNSVTITATVGTLTNTTTVFVTPAVVESISLSPASASIANGTTQQYTVNATFSDGSVQQLMEGLTFASSASSIASVNAAGLATGLSVGSTTITATYGTFTANADLTVTAATLTSIVVTPATPKVGINGIVQFTATGVYSDNSTQDLTSVVTWASSDATVALVDASGSATGLKNGTVTVTASYAGVSGSTTLTVTTATLQSITITPSNPIVPPHAKIQMTAWGNYSDGSKIALTSGVTWYSSSGRYCSISSSGLVRVKNKTSSQPVPIYAKMNGVLGQTTIIINTQPLQSLAITPVNPTIAVGTKQQFQLIGTFSNGPTVDLTRSARWQTSNYQDAVINSSGVATGVAPGAVTITATYSTLNPATTTLTVSTATIQSIAVTPANPSVVLGGMQQFTATGSFSDGSTQDITSVSSWTSTNPDVALVNSTGVATGVSSGQTNINATFKGVPGGTTLTVN